MIKKILTLILMGLILSCSNNSTEKKDFRESATITLSEADMEFIDSVEIDKSVFERIRQFSDSSFVKFYTSADRLDGWIIDSNKIIVNGFCIHESEEVARDIIYNLKDPLKEEGFLIYISEQNFGFAPEKVSIIESENQFDLLKVEETNGINYDITNEQVITTLKKWNQNHSFEIIAANFDGMEAFFTNPPTNWIDFANEVYQFCPDVVDQGTGSIEALAEEMKKSNTLYLWWD